MSSQLQRAELALRADEFARDVHLGIMDNDEAMALFIPYAEHASVCDGPLDFVKNMRLLQRALSTSEARYAYDPDAPPKDWS